MGDFSKLKKKDIREIIKMANGEINEELEASATELSDEEYEDILFILEFIGSCYQINSQLKELTDDEFKNIINNENISKIDYHNLIPLAKSEIDELIKRFELIKIDQHLNHLDQNNNINQRDYIINCYLHYLDNILILALTIVEVIKSFEALYNKQFIDLLIVNFLFCIGITISLIQKYNNILKLIDNEEEFNENVKEQLYYEQEYSEKAKTLKFGPLYYGEENKIN